MWRIGFCWCGCCGRAIFVTRPTCRNSRTLPTNPSGFILGSACVMSPRVCRCNSPALAAAAAAAATGPTTSSSQAGYLRDSRRAAVARSSQHPGVVHRQTERASTRHRRASVRGLEIDRSINERGERPYDSIAAILKATIGARCFEEKTTRAIERILFNK